MPVTGHVDTFVAKRSKSCAKELPTNVNYWYTKGYIVYTRTRKRGSIKRNVHVVGSRSARNVFHIL